MALKATIYKASLQLADMDRNLYGAYDLTIARHPSETDERMMIRLLAFALNVPGSTEEGVLELAKDLWDGDEPALWEKDLTGQIQHWIELGQPDERRLRQAGSRSRRLTVYSSQANTSKWWNTVAPNVVRARSLIVWQIPHQQSANLAGLTDRTMKLDVTIQDGNVWIGNGEKSVEVSLHRLTAG
jgi:uncharacterized protein YaeQ